MARNRDAIFDLHTRAGRSEIATSGATLTRRDPLGRGLIWPQRLDVTIGYPDRVERREVAMNGREATVPLGNGRPLCVVPNGVGIGYGLFRLDDATLQYLVRDFWMGVLTFADTDEIEMACRSRRRFSRSSSSAQRTRPQGAFRLRDARASTGPAVRERLFASFRDPRQPRASRWCSKPSAS